MFKHFKVLLLSLFVLPCFMLVGCSEHEHILSKVGAVGATCETSGNTEYYTCECGKYFSDDAAQQEILENSWVIVPTGHPDANSDDMCDTCGRGQKFVTNGVNYATLQDAFTNAQVGATVNVYDNITSTSELEEDKIIITKNSTVDFGDKVMNLDIPNATGNTANWVGINVNGGNVVFKATNNGGVKTANNAELYAVVVRNGANLTINGGNYIGGSTAISVTQGTVTINGGFFAAQTEDTTYTLNCVDAAYNNGTAKIIVKGGTFVNFNPEDHEAESGDHNSFVAAGYTVVSETKPNGDIWYTVVPGAKYVVNEFNYPTLNAAIAHATNGSTITLYTNTITDASIVVTKDIVLNLNGHNISASNTMADIGVLKVENTGKLTINGNGIINSASQGNNYGMAVWARNGGEVIINGGTYTNVGSKSQENDSPNNNELIYTSGTGSSIIINNGTFIGNYENATYGAGFTLNKYDAHRAVTTLLVKGGKFVSFNPADNLAEGVDTNFVAEGFTVEETTENGRTVYTVVAAN